jgi:hypothetical protein
MTGKTKEPVMISRRTLCLASTALGLSGLAGAVTARAGALAMPTGKPILTISGRINVTNVGDTAVFDRDMLEGLALTSFKTMTPWYEEPVTFSGVELELLMKVVGTTGVQLRAQALDDYTTEIPITDFPTWHPILAIRRNGEYMPVSDKGPLFIVYPFDSEPELKHQRFYSRSAWQVVRMVVV